MNKVVSIPIWKLFAAVCLLVALLFGIRESTATDVSGYLYKVVFIPWKANRSQMESDLGDWGDHRYRLVTARWTEHEGKWGYEVIMMSEY